MLSRGREAKRESAFLVDLLGPGVVGYSKEEKELTCRFCTRGFIKKTALLKHMRHQSVSLGTDDYDVSRCIAPLLESGEVAAVVATTAKSQLHLLLRCPAC